MDKTLISGKEAVEDKVPDYDTSEKAQPDDGVTEETTSDSPSRTAKPNEADEELVERLHPASVPEDGDSLCTVCGFSAKCPRSLKIHYARKHGKKSKYTNRTAKPAEKRGNIPDRNQAEIQQESDMETETSTGVKQNQESDLDVLKSAASDNATNTNSLTKNQTTLDKQQADQEEVIPTQERRVSKRTPKPKVIHSCNYCGQEFRDKSPLVVHIQRYHTKDTPYTFEADENMEEEKQAEDPGSTLKDIPTRVAPKRAFSRFQLKCKICDFRVSTPAFLESHVRVKHQNQEWYRCKVCDFFSATSEWMDNHLSSDSHMQKQKEEKSTESSSESSSYDTYVECVRRDNAGANIDDIADVSGTEGVATSTEGDQETEEAVEGAKSALVEEEDSELESPKKKRGRPKNGSTTTCGYCGLVVSNATNLSVHVRRKHSKEYGYSCTLCNYSCVTKGDMDRHCFTKKHVRRAQECANKNPINNHTSASQQEATTTQAPEPNAASQITDKEPESDNAASNEHIAEEQTQPDTSQKKSKYDSVNACSHCDFVAQSIPSLHLHVKRMHTKDYEYVCLACSYYAVTSREMTRHANTEKHKQKSQKYLEPLGSEGQKALEHPLKLKEVIEHVGANSDLECEPLSPTEESDSCTDDSQAMENQNTATPNVTTESDEAEAGAAGSGDNKQAESTTSSSSREKDPTIETVGLTEVCEPEQVPAELEPAVDQSAQQDSQEKVLKEADEEHLNANEMILEAKSDNAADTQMSKALPFDACIVSMKALAEQEQDLQEGLALEGEAAVICLTGGTPVTPGVQSANSEYVKKLQRKELKVREEAKGSSSRIRCEDCGFMADGISGLNVHISMKHPSKEKHFHCLVCGKSFYTESNLHQHLTSAAHLRNEQNSVEELPEGGASFKCVKCTDRFESEHDLFIHIKEKHEELLREVNKYVLEDTEQINREREENQGSVCKYCGKVCKSSNSMAFLAHIRTHTGSKPFKCKICNFATAQLGDARNHVKRHLGMREYRCDICGWAFVMKKHLSTHMLGKHGVGQRKERKFECQLCKRSFSEKWALNNHMLLHSGEKPYKCAWPSCHYAFLNLSAMKDHYRTHTGEKSYLCDLCGFAGGTRHALTKHRRQHTGERPFKCSLCNFASTTQSHLSRHKRVHTGEKPYRCPWCDYRSNCAENIRKHILHTGKHEGVKMYNCPKCSYATNSPMEFRNHLKENHPDIESPDLAYLHAGIVSKSFECRLKGQGATFVEAEIVDSPVHKGSSETSGQDDSIQQVIIIQGYGDGEVAIDQALEESAAATLQTLAMAGQVAEVLHITEDGQVIASGREVASAGAHLAGGSTQYVVLESGEARKELRAVARGGVAVAAAGQSHIVSESSTALDALLSAVSEVGHQEEMQGGAAVVHEVLTPEVAEAVQSVVQSDVKQEQDEVQVIQEAGQQDMQEVLQLAASQMMKEGLTQVIVNDEGTHYIVTELDNCTLQVEGGVYGEAAAGDGEVQQAEQQAGEEMVVYVDGTPHNIVLEG
ncbi:zinc finger protein 407 [Centropristis striata]|uniref:zinc finger protein 407 n=1 Tax=Centropristis striata TaxID=184440 RepID=UPI0027DFC0A5|nr:zinc finger protein 407 [Centropristis striata]XP_059195662.1 zinc finger protein 407 [Centropristis striata]